jgi:8-oxo-dGTP diphosphatase
MVKTTVAAVITKIENDKTLFLLVRRNTEPFLDYWSFPGGYVDQFETTEEAVVREVKEEVGLNFQPQFLTCFNEIIPSQNIHAVVNVFTGIATGVLKIAESEIKEARWFNHSEVESMELAFLHNQIFQNYLRQISITHNEELLAEYGSLREEILKRMEIRTQLLTFTLIVSGAILSYGASENASVLVLLIYPILAYFLALAWTHSDLRAGEIGDYIKDYIETKTVGIGWQTHLQESMQKQKKTIYKKATSFSAAGIFLVTEIASLFLALPKIDLTFNNFIQSAQVGLFLLADAIAIILTIVALRQRRKNM